MHRPLLLISMVLISTLSWAHQDSIAFFYSPNKVNVLINERGTFSRLHDFMNLFTDTHELLLVSENNDMKIGCARSVEKVACTFTFYPSHYVRIEDSLLAAAVPLTFFTPSVLDNFEMSFRSSMKDNLQLQIRNGVVVISGSKK
jgi:hypothetical protein